MTYENRPVFANGYSCYLEPVNRNHPTEDLMWHVRNHQGHLQTRFDPADYDEMLEYIED